jgi:guanine deaminase
MLLQKQTIKAGTTTACYFASLYSKASMILGEKAAKIGQRAFIGKVNMNSPRVDGYCESTEQSIKDTRAFIEAIEQIQVNYKLIFYYLHMPVIK